jgi:hypothetical protein
MDNGLDSKASKISSGTHELSLRLRLLHLSSGQTAERPDPDVHIAQGCKCRPTLIVLCALSKYSVDPADVWRDRNPSRKSCELYPKVKVNVK